ncbi:MAG: TRAP transporter small permease [Dehalococcoidia bacterium]|nr:TRAP transporter small permease [Dehalococcoidia bacterium]
MSSVTRIYQQADSLLYRFEAVAAGVGLGFSVAVTMLDVLLRNGGELLETLFGVRWSAGIGGGGEVAQVSMIWGMLIGAALGSRQGIHIGVDVLVQRLPATLCKAVVLVSLAAGAAFSAAVTLLGIELVQFSMNSGQITADVGMPRWMLYLSVPTAMALMTVHQLQVAAEMWRRPADEVKRSAQAVSVEESGA